jgi:AcrR family transcriptional regulator
MAKKYHHGDLRAALIQATVDTVAREGVHAVKVSALARQVGVSSAAPFRHFGSRTELLVAAAEACAVEWLAAVEEATAQAQNPLHGQKLVGVTYVRFATQNPGHFRLLTNAEVIAASSLLTELNAADVVEMDRVLGANRNEPAAARTAGTLAAEALALGLSHMIVDGLLGEVTVEQATELADKVMSVLGQGLGAGSQ